jgi:transposase
MKPRGRRHPIVLEAPERRELERRVAARSGSQQAALRARIILRAAEGALDSTIATELHIAVRTVFLWTGRFRQQRVAGLVDRVKHPAPRRYSAERQAKVLLLACQKPAEVDPTRAGQTHWRIMDLVVYLRAHPELDLGTPSKSTLGEWFKQHHLRLDRL